MSLRLFSSPVRFIGVSALALGIGLSGFILCDAAYADPSVQTYAVQTYADQAMPVQASPSQERYESPLAAGTLTLQDVLEAHKNVQAPPTLPKPPEGMNATPSATATAPLLNPAAKSSSTSLMLSQGMKDVLQKVGDVNVTPVQAKGAPATPPVATTAPTPVAAAPATAPNGAAYQPGQAPKNLATGQVATAAVSPDATSDSTTAPMTNTSSGAAPSCGQAAEKWEKTCGDAGYPANYVGKISGETRTGCADGALHDVWVTNSCAPPDGATAQTDKTDAACGIASDNEFDAAPSTNLCAQGISSVVKGDGPWTWACSGVNGGAAAACTAQKRAPMSNGVCGDANGVAVSAAPSSDLCSNGTATEIKSTKNGWTWSCRGRGKGGVQSCIAPTAKKDVDTEVVAVPAPVVASLDKSSSEKATSVVAVSVPASADDKGELCGTAAETLATQAPEKDLCRVGTASMVNGDGPWTWSCTDNEGTTSSCRSLSLTGDGVEAAPVSTPAPAPQKPVQSVLMAHKPTGFVQPSSSETTGELACGLAASQPASQSPTGDLCEGGKASAVRGSGPWHWTCANKAHHKVSCETVQSLDGACGPANGTSLKSAPFAGLCGHGTPSSIDGNGPWTWVCNGSGGGSNVNCAASVAGKQAAVDGACGSSDGNSFTHAPSDGLCVNGTASDVSGEGPWTWSCSGLNGGGVSTCSASKMAVARAPGPSVNGLCGFANGVVTDVQPGEGLCGTGNASGVVGNGPWNWSCVGENGGMTVSCTAPLTPPAPIDGTCGGASGVPTLVKPQSGLCSAGITGSVNGKGPWTWVCSGANGGNPASCNAPIAGKTGGVPSAMTVAADNDNAPAPVAAPSGLVTPRLAGSSTLAPLDKTTLPSLTQSKSRAAAAKAAQAPALADVSGNDVPDSTPNLPDDSQPVAPPKHKLLPAPALQEQPTDTAPVIAGNHLTLDPTISTVLFDRNSGNIAANVVTTLDRLSAVLTANPDVRISLTAYADNVGSTPRDARRLSLTRGLAVKDYLANKGVAESRIDVHAEGANTTSGYIDRVDVKVNN